MTGKKTLKKWLAELGYKPSHNDWVMWDKESKTLYRIKVWTDPIQKRNKMAIRINEDDYGKPVDVSKVKSLDSFKKRIDVVLTTF